MDFRNLWLLDSDIAYLNHGSFGACPESVLDYQATLRERMEREPVRFFVHELESMMDDARQTLADFVHGDSEGLVFVTNATTAINTVLRSLELNPGDELLCTDHEYNAARNALNHAAALSEAQVVAAEVPFPIESPEQVLQALLDRVTDRTRFCLVDHITSATALVFPITDIVRHLRERGIVVLVDGAHGPGMVPLDMEEIGADFYTGNCHKWLCAPKGAAFLWIAEEWRDTVRPLVISHGANSLRTDRSRLLLEFDWVGTTDPTPFLSITESISYMGSLLPGGWPELMEHNRRMVLDARPKICDSLGIPLPCPEEMVGSIASFPLPDAKDANTAGLGGHDLIHQALFEQHRIELPIFSWPAPPKRVLRVSAQVYNRDDEYERLADVLRESGILE
jgi:isopenicillin-N epimerase